MGRSGLSVVEGRLQEKRAQNPLRQPKTPENPAKSSLKADQEQCFVEDFWPQYPRKVARFVAFQAFCKLVLTPEDLDSVLKGLAWYRSHEWVDRPLDKIPHAATWLNQRRFLDAP